MHQNGECLEGDSRLDWSLRSEIIDAVREALGNHPCRFNSLNPQQVEHISGMLMDIGDGDVRKGVEVVRSNHKWTKKRLTTDPEYTANHELVSSIRRGMGSVGTHIAKAAAWALIVGLAILAWLGFQVRLFK